METLKDIIINLQNIRIELTIYSKVAFNGLKYFNAIKTKLTFVSYLFIIFILRICIRSHFISTKMCMWSGKTVTRFLISNPQALSEIKMDAACCGETGLVELATWRLATLLPGPVIETHCMV